MVHFNIHSCIALLNHANKLLQCSCVWCFTCIRMKTVKGGPLWLLLLLAMLPGNSMPLLLVDRELLERCYVQQYMCVLYVLGGVLYVVRMYVLWGVWFYCHCWSSETSLLRPPLLSGLSCEMVLLVLEKMYGVFCKSSMGCESYKWKGWNNDSAVSWALCSLCYWTLVHPAIAAVCLFVIVPL